MKTLTQLKTLSVLACAALILSSCSGRMYKNARVKIDADKLTHADVKTAHNGIIESPTTTEKMVIAENDAVTSEVENAPVATVNKVSDVRKVNNKVVKTTRTAPVKTKAGANEKLKKTALDMVTFTSKITKGNGLFKVEDVENAQMETWLLLVIILGSAAFLFLILLIIGYATYSWGLILISWIFFWLCLTAMGVFLVLGLLGIM